MYDFCSYMFTLWLQGLEPKTVQPVVLAILSTLSRLNFDEIRSRYISGGSSTIGTPQTSVHTKRFVNYGIFRIELDIKQPKNRLKKRLHVGCRIESSFGSMNVILYQTFLLLREEYDINVRWDDEWMDNLRSFAVSKTLHFPQHH